MDWFTRILLSPIAMIYGFLISVRNACYESGLLRSTSFDLPIVCVGNIKVGGTGKTPLVEWLILQLQPYMNVAVLSRGYSRKTKGYRKVQPRDQPIHVGDEAILIKRKFPDVAVAVSESRTLGLSSLLMDYPSTQIVVLDDAFQHRSIKPELTFVLTEYEDPFFEDYIMPMGKLREWRSAIKRADLLIVSKCPDGFTKENAEGFKAQNHSFEKNNIYFSSIHYTNCYAFDNGHDELSFEANRSLFMLSGIGTPKYLYRYLDSKTDNLYEYNFPDHHKYSATDIKNIIEAYQRIPSKNKAFVTTEKDIVKLLVFKEKFIAAGIRIYVQRIETKILLGQEQELQDRIQQFLLNFAR